MEFEMQTSGGDMAVQDNARWERNCRMAKEVASGLGLLALLLSMQMKKGRSDVLWQQKWKVCFMSAKPHGMA